MLILYLMIFIVTLVARFWQSPLAEVPARCHSIGDEWDYHTLAINIMRGNGYTETPVDPIDTYDIQFTTEQLRASYTERRLEGVIPFYRPPLYPLVLSMAYAVLGPGPRSAWVLQMLLSALSAVLIVVIARQLVSYRPLFGLVVGVFASLVFAVDSDIGSYVGVVHTESLSLFLLLVSAVLVSVSVNRRTDGRIWFWAGLALAGCALTRPNNVLVFLWVVTWMAPLLRKTIRPAFFIAGFFAILLPWASYASFKAGRLVLVSSNGPVNFALGNIESVLDHPAGTPKFTPDSYPPHWPSEGLARFLLDRGIREGTTALLSDPTAIPRRLFWKIQATFGHLSPFIFLLSQLGLVFLARFSDRAHSLRITRRFYRLILALLVLAFLVPNRHYGIAIICAATGVIAVLVLADQFFRHGIRGEADIRQTWLLGLIPSVALTSVVFFGSRRFLVPFAPFLSIGIAVSVFALAQVLSGLLTTSLRRS